MNLEQATRRVEDNLRSALACLPARARAERVAGGPVPCDEPADDGPVEWFVASVDYRIRGVPPEEYGRCLDALLAWWTGNGFVVLTDARPQGLYVWVRHAADGFQMAVQANERGELYLTSTSPGVRLGGEPA
ncbi:hypothetical protein [Actinoallomurus acaciae]|uniref:Uncharacterized protein n=1 Tax=Actinoallomurus acaciae TaxID=502577 RepID=A0ABV5YD99_9ACTN